MPSGSAHEHGDGQRGVAHVEHRLGRPRALRREDEATEVGAGRNRRIDVLLAGEPADLHHRPREERRERRSRVGRAHERGADENRVRAGQLRLDAVHARLDAALGDDRPIPRRSGHQLELRAAGRRRTSRGRGR